MERKKKILIIKDNECVLPNDFIELIDVKLRTPLPFKIMPYSFGQIRNLLNKRTFISHQCYIDFGKFSRFGMDYYRKYDVLHKWKTGILFAIQPSENKIYFTIRKSKNKLMSIIDKYWQKKMPYKAIIEYNILTPTNGNE